MADFKCNHCKSNINVADHDLYDIYEEGVHEVDCPKCDEKLFINSIAVFEFEVQDEDGNEIYDWE